MGPSLGHFEEPGAQHIPSTSFTILPFVIIIQSGGPQNFR